MTMDVHDNASALATRAGEELLAPKQEPGAWAGCVGRMVFSLLHLLSSGLYWAIRLATITLPTFIFQIFSSSWTVTMNATTL